MEWIEPLAYVAGAVVVIVAGYLVNRFTGYRLPQKIKDALFQIVNTLVAGSLKKNPSIAFPAPPVSLAIITGEKLKELLKPYGIDLECPLDTQYLLPDKSDYLRFIKWYKANTPVKLGDYTEWFNCDAFAWIMVAYALLWMKGKCAFGYVEARSTDKDYKYPMHAFCFVVDWNNDVYFVDPLGVAASIDDLDPAYKVCSQDAKA